MQNNNLYNDVVIEQSWSLLAFAKENGLPKIREDVNKETGESFTSLCFDDGPKGRVFCHFGRSTQGFGIEEIQKQKDNLRVGLNSNGRYTLYLPDTKGTVIELW